MRLSACRLLAGLLCIAACRPAELPVARYTTDELEYFAEVAFGGEYSGTPFVHRWTKGVDVRLAGAPTPDDRAEVERVAADLSALTGRRVRVTDDRAAPMAVYFVSRDSMEIVLPQYTPGNDGYVYITWDATGAIQRGTVVIDKGVDLRFRRHLVREELTQGFGLLQDSFRYDDSIFQQRYTDVTAYAPIDEAVIRMLYEPDVQPGMSRARALEVLRALE